MGAPDKLGARPKKGSRRWLAKVIPFRPDERQQMTSTSLLRAAVNRAFGVRQGATLDEIEAARENLRAAQMETLAIIFDTHHDGLQVEHPIAALDDVIRYAGRIMGAHHHLDDCTRSTAQAEVIDFVACRKLAIRRGWVTP